MLKLRILTAIVLLPPLLAVLFFASSSWVATVFGLFIAAGAWEWTGLIGVRNIVGRILYASVLVALGAALMWIDGDVTTVVLLLAFAGWVIAVFELARWSDVHQGWLVAPGVRLVTGFFVLIPAWVSLYILHAADPQRPAVLLFALSLVWIADSMAYFAGHQFGRTKLAPTISPGKTVEGVVGGVVSVAIVAGLAGVTIWQYRGATLALWIALSVVAALFSVSGDLLESKFKRVAGVKDSGRLLPGHGGALDRIDALTAALPVFALGWHLWFRTV